MKSRLITLGFTTVALLLGQQALANQNVPAADASESMLCVDVVASASVQHVVPGIPDTDKASLRARIKQQSLEVLKQAANPVLLQQQSRQAVVGNGKLLQASL